MSEPSEARLGPPTFSFTPTVHGPVAAFSLTFRVLAVLMLLALALAIFRRPDVWHTSLALWGALAWLLMAATVWAIWRSRTSLSSERLQQTWLWNKTMPMRELAYARLMRYRRLEWLIAPRLYVRSFGGRFTFIYCADAAMLDDMQRLCSELKAMRRF